MKDTLTYLLSNIVDNPNAVSVEESQEEGIIQYVITVAPEDMGKVIGKEGRVIRSIRNVMKIPAIKQGKRINISLAHLENRDETQN